MAAETAEVCRINIGPRQRRQRQRFGVGVLAFSAVGYGLLLWGGEPRLWRLGLFLPLWLGALGIFQARAKT